MKNGCEMAGCVHVCPIARLLPPFVNFLFAVDCVDFLRDFFVPLLFITLSNVCRMSITSLLHISDVFFGLIYRKSGHIFAFRSFEIDCSVLLTNLTSSDCLNFSIFIFILFIADVFV